MKRLWKNHKGVTMMEVLVTVGILAIVVVPCLSSFIVAQHGNVLAKQTYNEYTEAANLIEELKGMTDEQFVQRLNTVMGIEDDNLTVRYDDMGDYYEVRIYAGELTKEQIAATDPIIKGVIAP